MRKSFLLLSFAVIPVIAPLWGPTSEFISGSRAQVREVPLPQLTPQQWKMLLQRQGVDQKRLHIGVGLSLDHGRVYTVTVRSVLAGPLRLGYLDSGRRAQHYLSTLNWELNRACVPLSGATTACN